MAIFPEGIPNLGGGQWRGALGGTSAREERRLRKQQVRDVGRQEEDIQYAQQGRVGTPTGSIAQALMPQAQVGGGGRGGAGGGSIYDFLGRLAQRLPESGQTGGTIQEQLLKQMTMAPAREPYAGPMYGWMRQFPEYTTGYKYPGSRGPSGPERQPQGHIRAITPEGYERTWDWEAPPPIAQQRDRPDVIPQPTYPEGQPRWTGGALGEGGMPSYDLWAAQQQPQTSPAPTPIMEARQAGVIPEAEAAPMSEEDQILQNWAGIYMSWTPEQRAAAEADPRKAQAIAEARRRGWL